MSKQLSKNKYISNESVNIPIKKPFKNRFFSSDESSDSEEEKIKSKRKFYKKKFIKNNIPQSNTIQGFYIPEHCCTDPIEFNQFYNTWKDFYDAKNGYFDYDSDDVTRKTCKCRGGCAFCGE
ncbi:hypothetical protein Catovirus_1_624 [Catovirus CTV1]|uniref:Uncharacterized protein n=1 Tax=Catovirus CTV1 TaxID=1977631 RepID=A0A1V0SA69_9VIRU|nr:hypothetical protein Catovirus_1_624 [Catovirus CTV1]